METQRSSPLSFPNVLPEETPRQAPAGLPREALFQSRVLPPKETPSSPSIPRQGSLTLTPKQETSGRMPHILQKGPSLLYPAASEQETQLQGPLTSQEETQYLPPAAAEQEISLLSHSTHHQEAPLHSSFLSHRELPYSLYCRNTDYVLSLEYHLFIYHPYTYIYKIY